MPSDTAAVAEKKRKWSVLDLQAGSPIAVEQLCHI